MYQPPCHVSCTNPSTGPYTNDVQYHIEDRRNPISKHNNAAEAYSVASFYSCVSTFLPKTHAGSIYIFADWYMEIHTGAMAARKPIRTQPFTNTNPNDMHNFSSCVSDKPARLLYKEQTIHAQTLAKPTKAFRRKTAIFRIINLALYIVGLSTNALKLTITSKS